MSCGFDAAVAINDHAAHAGELHLTRRSARGRFAPQHDMEDAPMLKWAVIFLIVAIVAAVFGFTGIAGTATDIAKILFFVFIVLFLIGLVLGLIKRPPA